MSLISLSQGITLSVPITSLNRMNFSNPSLSHQIEYRINSTIEYIPFPPRPTCELLLDVQEEQYPVAISTWKIDLNDKGIQGILMWREAVTTVCTFTFWGHKSHSTEGSYTTPFGTLPSQEDLNRFLSLPIDEITEFPVIEDYLKFYCYYCVNNYKNTYYRSLYKHVYISRYPDGSIRSPVGPWTHMNDNYYTDGKRYLYISPSFQTQDVCPFKIHEARFGIVALSKTNTMILSIPSIKQQYSIPEGSDYLECKTDGTKYTVWHTAGGYLVSFSGESIPSTPDIRMILGNNTSIRQKRSIPDQDIISTRFGKFNSKHSRHQRSTNRWEFASHLRSDLVYSQFRYETSFVLSQINKNLVLIQNSICESMLMRWSSLYPPDLPRKVANFVTRSSTSIGEFRDSVYKVTSTIPHKNDMELILPIFRVKGHYRVMDKVTNLTYWIEPITGILFKTPQWTHYSMVATWLPMANGSGFDPLTGKLVLSQATNTPITLINQAEAYYPKTLYEQGSLAGIFEDNSFYNTPSSPGDSSSGPVWWSPFITHIITGLLSLIVVIVLFPALLKLFSSCVMKGEETVEKTCFSMLCPKRKKTNRLLP